MIGGCRLAFLATCCRPVSNFSKEVGSSRARSSMNGHKVRKNQHLGDTIITVSKAIDVECMAPNAHYLGRPAEGRVAIQIWQDLPAQAALQHRRHGQLMQNQEPKLPQNQTKRKQNHIRIRKRKHTTTDSSPKEQSG
mmetsp:Transcript_5355/g.15732  ORF Transcript_5355/g.15732 Transcript_5355/m.15732 type:complete len:137 (+) Transcript_5355:2-412(+)